jgi:three-Cys-motif partner protein
MNTGESMIPEAYKGRESAFIKHTLLRSYLERLFMILGQFEKTICYADCFAGPWQEESGSGNLEGTSIAISLEIMEKCRAGLLKHNKDVQFRALFIEKDKNAFARLQRFLDSKADRKIQTKAMHGEFINLRDDILKWCGTRDFTFFFIDPTGWKDVVEIETLKPLLQRPHSEYLINFMFDFILRTHTQPVFSINMQEIFGEVPDTSGMAPKERETFLIDLYRLRLKGAQPTSRVKVRSAYVKVLDTLKDRTKYELVYLTRHPKGIQIFMDASEKLDFIQKRVRAHAKQEQRIAKTQQQELFSVDAGLTDFSGTDFEEVKEYWLRSLSAHPKRFGIEELADMMEETGWFESDLQAALKELIQEGKAKNLDAGRMRPKNVIDFDKKERLLKV